jgi:flagellar biosynthesis chaperone FliJ
VYWKLILEAFTNVYFSKMVGQSHTMAETWNNNNNNKKLHWKELTGNRKEWNKLVEKAKTHPGWWWWWWWWWW